MTVPTTAPALAAPWYVHPAEDPAAWGRLRNGDNTLAFAVINPANGPGPDDDPYYSQALKDAFATRLLGYVDTSYGQRPVDQVLADVDCWLRRRVVTGIMLDCVPAQHNHEHWSLQLIDQVRQRGAGFVAVNPGTPPTPELIMSADLTCTGEYSWSTLRQFESPAWLRELPSQRQWMLVHDVPVAEQAEALSEIAERGAGYGWATSGQLPNPWAQLPAQW